MFDRKARGSIDYEDFIYGLSICCRGSVEERMRFVFEVYDISGCVRCTNVTDSLVDMLIFFASSVHLASSGSQAWTHLSR